MLSANNSGSADAGLLQLVESYLSSDDIRPLTDTVQVQAAEIIDFEVRAILHLFPGPSGASVIAAAKDRLISYLDSVSRIGYDITQSGIYAALHQPGVRLVTLISPATDILIADRQAARCIQITITEGERDV